METILIIEDDRDTLNSIVEILQGEGYNTFQAENQTDGLLLAQEQYPDLILCDLRLPEGDEGFEILEELQKNKATVVIPFILLTASGNENDISKGFSLGAKDYIIKPASPKEILARVKNHLDLKKLRIELEQKNRDLEIRNKELSILIETELKNRDLEKINELLNDKQKLIDKNRSFASYKVKNKLTSIHLQVEKLNKKSGIDEDIKKGLKNINHSCVEILGIVEDFLE